MALLEVRNLSVQYRTRQGPAHALDRASFSLEPGQVLGVVGESGCGKTTMAMALMGLLNEEANVAGEVILDGRDVTRLDAREWQRLRGKDVAMIFQGAMNAWNPVYSVGDQIVETILTHEPNLRISAARDRVAQLFAAVGLAADRLNDFPHQYSGGMKQRAVIAMALACNPKLIVADEPTTALDVIVQDRILRELHRIQRERRLSMIYISHDVAVVAEISDLVAVMYAGQVVEMGPAAEVFTRPVHPYTAALLGASPSLRGPKRALRGLSGGPPSLLNPPSGCRFSPRCARATAECSVNAPLFAPVRHGVSAACFHPIEEAFAAETEPVAVSGAEWTQPPVIEVVRASQHFGGAGGFFSRSGSIVRAVDEVSLEIGEGEIFGLVGESGSGKTTLGRMLVRLTNPTGGKLRIRLGEQTRDIDAVERRDFRRNVQMIFQDPYESLNPRMTIGDVVMEPLGVLKIGSAETRQQRVRSMIERVGLTPAESFVHRYPHELSGGQRQRIAVARAMVVAPKFIVADEPTSMLDVSVRAGIMDLLLDLRREFRVGCFYITHDLAVARYLCDRLAVMYKGKIVESGPTDAVLQSPRHPYTKALIAAVPIADPTYRRPAPNIHDAPSAVVNTESHCRFLARCPEATERCRAEAHPPLVELAPGHTTACYEAT